MYHSEPSVQTINVGKATINPHKASPTTGIHKRPVDGAVYIAAAADGNSGVDGDFIGDTKNHGGADQAVYAFQREDLDRWERVKDRDFENGAFGENLTTVGIDVNGSLIGEHWRIGNDLVIEVTGPRIPCTTFRGVIAEPRWLKDFTHDSRPGAYFRVIVPGSIEAGDGIEVIYRPPHDVSVSVAFMAITTNRSLVARLRAASEYLSPDLIEYAATAILDTDIDDE